MRRIWIEILNEVIAAKDTITLSLKLSRNSITITIGSYKKTIKRYPHLNTIENLIHRLSDAGCTINIKIVFVKIQNLLKQTFYLQS